MADISKIGVKGETYDIKDAVAREAMANFKGGLEELGSVEMERNSFDNLISFGNPDGPMGTQSPQDKVIRDMFFAAKFVGLKFADGADGCQCLLTRAAGVKQMGDAIVTGIMGPGLWYPDYVPSYGTIKYTFYR